MSEPEIQRPQKNWEDKKTEKRKRIFNSDERRHLKASVFCVKRPTLEEANQYFTQSLHPSRLSARTALDMVKKKKTKYQDKNAQKCWQSLRGICDKASK